jgi:DNA-binding CsgD family transcriptional regulator/tetratricopeptide (TPR) repeat protein
VERPKAVPSFVGRVRELAQLEAALDDAVAGRPRVVLVAGEAGVGKSRLLDESVAAATARGTRVLEGSCLPTGDGGPPFAPIVAILRSLGRSVPTQLMPALLGPGRADLARLVPELVDRAADLPSVPIADPTAQVRLFELVAGAVDRIARREPLVVLVEDVHWADRASRDLVDFLIRGLRDERLLLLMTLRTDGLALDAPARIWAAELGRLPSVDRIDLGPLSRSEVADLAASVLGHPASPPLADRLTERAGGNPFLVEELVTIATADGESLPAHLREVLLARLAPLRDQTRVVLSAASAAGRWIDDGLLAESLELAEPELLAALHDALDHGVLVRPVARTGTDRRTELAFRHALLREAVYDELLPRERQRLHLAYATALAGRAAIAPDSVATSELAYHWDAAGDRGHALAAHIQAGREAMRMVAAAQARHHHERALELWSQVDDPVGLTGTERSELNERAADAAALDGDYAAAVVYARAAIAEVDAVAEPVRAGSLRERLRFLLWEAGDHEAAAEAVAEALRLIPAEPPTNERARALAHAAGLDMYAGRPREALARGREAIAVARAAIALPEEALALGVVGWATATLGHVDEGIASFREGMRIAEVLGSVEGQALGYTNLAALLDRVGRAEDALAVAREGFAVVARNGLARTFGGSLRAHEARMLFHLGRWDEAEAVVDAGLDLVPVAPHRLFLLAQRARIAAARGRADEADAAHAEATVLERSLGSTEYASALLEARAETAAWSGHLEAGRAVLDEATAIPTAGRPPDPALAWVGAVGLRLEADAAEDARARRDIAGLRLAEMRASAVVEWMRGWLPAGGLDRQEAAARALEPRAAAIVALLRAEHGRLSGRDDPLAWSTVVEAWTLVGRSLPTAYGWFREGAARLAAGDRTGARTALARADEVAQRLGAEPLARAVAGLARPARLDVRAAAPAIPDAVGEPEGSDALGLTPREIEVLRLVAAGWSNPQIGEALGISRKTASVHVSNLLGKLGVENRTEAAVVATRIGLGDATLGPIETTR